MKRAEFQTVFGTTSHTLRWLAVALAAALFPSQPIAARETPPTLQAIAPGQLPAEARATLHLVKQGGPFPHARDGFVFHNRENQLPPQQRGWYREYTVPTPGSRDRGARRIVAGRDGLFYYSDDHYRSFQRIRE